MTPKHRRAAVKTSVLIIVVIIVLAGILGGYYIMTSTTPTPTTVTTTTTQTTTQATTSTTTATTTATTTTTSVSSTTATTTLTSTVRPVKIAVVSDIGGRGDLSFNDMGFKGGAEAEKDFGVEMVEIISEKESDYVPNLRTAASDPDVKLIVGVGYLLSDALAEIAPKFPDKLFAGIDTYAQSIVIGKTNTFAPNLLDISYEEHKGSALVGALAALTAIQYNKPYIGVVLGIEIPVLWKFEIGYKWGADWAIKWYQKKFGTTTVPGIGATPVKERVLWTYTGTFSDITKGYEAAKAMYAKDAVAVYNVAGPLGLGINQAIQEISKQKGLTRGPPFWIGVDADQDWINPGFILSSMMKRVDKGVYYSTKWVVENKFRDIVKSSNGSIVLGIGTKVAGEVFEGISVSTLSDLDAFIQMGLDAEKLTGKKVLPMSPDEIKATAKAMRDAQPSWVWEGMNELQNEIRSGQVTVPLALTKDVVDYWRGQLG